MINEVFYMRSSIGCHTANIFMKITVKEAALIYEDFMRYEKETGGIRIRPIHTTKIDSNTDPFIKKLYSSLPKIHRIEYLCKNKGIRWELRRNTRSPAYITQKQSGEDKPCSIKAKINPKILSGETDYLSAATADCFEEVEVSFDIEAEKISSSLKNFNSYSYNRIDYCFNGDIQELKIGCTAEQMMKLIKRSNIPDGFIELKEYDKNSHRAKAYKHSFYLKNNSVVINCYGKNAQLKQQYPDNICLEDSRDLIRFEVQCKYPKVYAISSKIEKRAGGSHSILMKEMISDKVCRDTIEKYFHKIVRKGNYFTLDGARWMVEAYHFRRDKEERLIEVLEFISECRGIAKAKDKFRGEELKEFKRSLKDLDEIFVNPVTIPRNWGIDYIPNLLQAYDNTIFDEHLVFLNEYKARKLLSEYLLLKGYADNNTLSEGICLY